LVVDDKVVVEVKSAEEINDTHRAQILNYLRISGLRVGLLINFAKPKLKYERFII
jgi:GxxExxY protein